jgi:undecaprenyl-diphosphatase
MRIFLFVFAFLCTSPAFSATASGKAWKDFKTSFSYLFQGSYLQFKQKQNLYYLGAAAPALWYSFDQDDRISALSRRKDIPKHIDFVGDMGVFFNLPIAPAAVYLWARSNENTHAMQFVLETFATTYLSLIESNLISFIPIHDRPDTSGLSHWETSFRADSSFPSGHIISYAAITLKTFQFYGPYWAIAPMVVTVWASQQRVMDGKHYLSDVVGGFFLTALASEGVRAAAGYSKNHPTYKWLFERNFQVGVTRHEEAVGPIVSLEF